MLSYEDFVTKSSGSDLGHEMTALSLPWARSVYITETLPTLKYSLEMVDNVSYLLDFWQV